MQIKVLFIAVLFFISFCVQAQVGMGKWRMHISPDRAIGVVSDKNSIYVALENGLLEYDLTYKEKTLRTAANYLSDITLSSIAYHDKKNTVFIGYSNGNLDLLHKEKIININAIKEANISGVKRINKMIPHKNNMYLATGFGIVVINTDKNEVRDTYYPTSGNQPVVDLAFTKDSIYALTSNKIYVASLNNNFLADPAQWSVLKYIPDYSETGKYISLVPFNNDLFLAYDDEIYNSDTLFRILNYQTEVFLDKIELNNLTVSNNEMLFVLTEGAFRSFDSNLDASQLIYKYENETFPRPVGAVFEAGNYYFADRRIGLVKAPNSYYSERISFEGPERANAYRTDWRNGRLAVAGGVMGYGAFSLLDEKWSTIEFLSQELLNSSFRGFVSVSVNPTNRDEIALGSFTDIPLALSKNSKEITDTFGVTNTLLETSIEAANAGLSWCNISDLTYDLNGNLWILNAGSNRPLKVYTADGDWFDYELGSAVRNKETRRLKIDNNGVKWFAVDGAGVVAFDDNGTIGDASDDRFRILNNSPNSGDLPTTVVEALAVDFNNNIWVGTQQGMRVLFNSNNVFDADAGDYNFQRLLIEFGENVEIVLGTTHITSIEIDGANRKWIGTANAGVFLFSSDGLSMIKNFTAQNSPLLSNTIMDISIDQNTGEVYFSTNNGLISYRSDASRGDSEYTNVNVFPNPVYPDYFGPITIQGIAYNSDVKITDISGKLVYQTTSNGGTATWNGKTLDGKRATTGVYLIWTTIDDENTKGRKVGKVVFIN